MVTPLSTRLCAKAGDASNNAPNAAPTNIRFIVLSPKSFDPRVYLKPLSRLRGQPRRAVGEGPNPKGWEGEGSSHPPHPTLSALKGGEGKASLTHPRPTKGIFVAITVMLRIFASSGSDAMVSTAFATCCRSSTGSGAMRPSACTTPCLNLSAQPVSALPISIWPQAMSYLRPSSAVDLVRPKTACFEAL